jgi:hypothetical protein
MAEAKPVITRTPFTLFEDFEKNEKGVIRKRNLKFDLNALADFEQMMGMGFAQLMQMKAVFAVARALLWAGLKHEDRTLTLEKVGDLLSRFMREKNGSVDDVLNAAFGAALEQGAMGRAEEPESEPETPGGNAPAPGSPASESPSPSNPGDNG